MMLRPPRLGGSDCAHESCSLAQCMGPQLRSRTCVSSASLLHAHRAHAHLHRSMSPLAPSSPLPAGRRIVSTAQLHVDPEQQPHCAGAAGAAAGVPQHLPVALVGSIRAWFSFER